MSRFLIAITAGLALTADRGWSTQDTFTVNGYDYLTAAPTVDATNFVNLGWMSISTLLPFDFSNVQNFTNRNYMANSSSGFKFDTSPSGSGSGNSRMAKNFYNAPMVPAGVASIYGFTHVLVSATNIVNRGLLDVGNSGLISLQGNKVDISRSLLQVEYPTGLEGIRDIYRFFGTNRLNPAANFISASTNGLTGPNTPNYQVLRPPNTTNTMRMLLNDRNFGAPPSVTGTEFTYEEGTNRTVQIVFVRNPNPDITVQIESSGGTETRVGEITVRWSSIGTNASGQIYDNSIYLSDSFGSNPTNVLVTNTTVPLVLHPRNFTISRTTTNLVAGDVGVPFTNKPPEFWGITSVISNALYSANGVRITAGTATTDTQTPQLAGGRVEIDAKDTLDTSYSRIEAYGYLRMNATNHFVGAASSTMAIVSPYADINLGSTNGFLQMKGMIPDTISRISGTLDIYSTVWTNQVDIGGATNTVLFNVLMVDSSLASSVVPELFTLGLRSTNVVIGDRLNISSNFQVRASSFTVEPEGMLNLGIGIFDWPASTPGLKTLTNRGTLYLQANLNLMARGTNGTDQPYQSLYNEGFIEANNINALASRIDSSGYLYSFYGPVSLVATTNLNLSSGGVVNSYYGDINLSARDLSITNHILQPGRSINLSVTNSLMAGPNYWNVYDGFNLWVKPATGDLAQVEVYNLASDYQESTSTWAGKDYGPVAAGFTNNAALGRLTLDGGLYSLFVFSGAGPSSNALYVDVLYLANSATNRDSAGNLTSISINPGMKIYFGQAYFVDGLGNFVNVTTELAGKNGGAFGQVTHAGPLSLPLPPATINPAIKVVVEKSPQLRSLISWQTPAKATNVLYYTANPYANNWQVLTNFVSGATSGTVTIPDPGLSTSRFYRAKIDVPAY